MIKQTYIQAKAKAEMAEGFYVDFMPMVQKIKTDLLAINIRESDKDTVNHITEQLKAAEHLLNQLKNFSETVKGWEEPKNEN